MKVENASITKRLILSVLVLEFLAGVMLIAAVAVNERHIQYKAFDANLRAASNALLGAVQEGPNDSVRLDLHGQELPRDSIYRVTDEHDRLLSSAGELPTSRFQPYGFQHARVDGHSYRFFTLAGERVIDPEQAGGIHHTIKIVYGLPDGRVWHEVIKAVRFFTICTVILLGLTALLLVLLIRRLLSPIRSLAHAAEEITSAHWRFNPPPDASKFTELRPLKAAIESTIAKLQRSFEQQKRFTRDAAHELKTDLAIVKSSLQLLSMKRRSVDEYQRGLLIGLDDLTRLERTVHKMLTLARAEQQETSRDRVCRIDEALLVAVKQAMPLADLRSVGISVFSIEKAVVPLDSGDALLLCSNILSNALQHSPEQAVVEVSSDIRDEQLHLSVRDRGEGVNEADAPFLFEPFYRGDPSRSRKTGGTGLGLSICKAICERVGGTIKIANHAEGGALVTVTLPMTQPDNRPEVVAWQENGFS